MSYTAEDAAWDDAYDRMSQELYPEHKERAIIDFTYARLRSFYVKNPDVLVPAGRNFKLAKALLDLDQPAAALVFAASAAELFLKGALLRPVVYGLVHSEALAELVVDAALAQTGFKRYQKLLAGLFETVAHLDIESLARTEGVLPLVEEASRLQDVRNGVVHRGDDVSQAQAEIALAVAGAIFDQVLGTVLWELGLSVGKGGRLVDEER